MAQQRVTCAQCGNQEAAGVRFCGRCGAPMQGGGAPRSGRPNQIAAGPGAAGAGGSFTQNPAAIAAVLGVVAVVIVLAALMLSGGDDKKVTDPNARRPGGGDPGGDFPTQVVVNPAATATPLVIVVPPTPTPVPPPTPTPEPPPPTPEPPPPTPIPPPPPEPTPIPPPPPQPTPIPPPPQPQVPAAKITNPFLVGLTITGGHGSAHRIGTTLQLCYTAVPGVWVRVYDTKTPNVLLFPEGVDNGQGDCINGVVDPPAGVDTIRIDAYTYIQQPNGTRTRGNFRDFATISIVATP